MIRSSSSPLARVSSVISFPFRETITSIGLMPSRIRIVSTVAGAGSMVLGSCPEDQFHALGYYFAGRFLNAEGCQI